MVFLKNKDGSLVTIDGAPIIVKVLNERRKPRACQQCGFSRWCLGDTSFVITNRNDSSLEWLCPNCAVERGLSKEFYRRNHYLEPKYYSGVGCLSTEDFNDGMATFGCGSPQHAFSNGGGDSTCITKEDIQDDIAATGCSANLSKEDLDDGIAATTGCSPNPKPNKELSPFAKLFQMAFFCQ